MKPFRVVAPFQPAGDQAQAIETISKAIKKGEKYLNREIRYDGKIITLSFCLSDTCSPKLITEGGGE